MFPSQILNIKGLKIIAVDFDGCLFVDEWPFIGEPIKKNIERLKKEQREGAKTILWTCRHDGPLKEAVQVCLEYGIKFDAINDNIPEIIAAYGTNPRKVTATEYWDNQAVVVNEKRSVPVKKKSKKRKPRIILDEFSKYKKSEIKIAKELRYNRSVIDALNEATTIGEIERIMHSARIK